MLNGTIKQIDADNNVADILTKLLPIDSFTRHATTLTKGFGGKPFITKVRKAKRSNTAKYVNQLRKQKSNTK